MSLVDVIIPCYKYAHFLKTCVDSIAAQDGVDVRMLIIDDASPDHTPDVCSDLAARNSRIDFRRHKNNQGPIATFNEGLDWATGDYTLLISADDLLTEGALERAVRLMENHPEVALTYGKVVVFRSGDPLPDLPAAENSCECEITPGRQFLHRVCSTGNFVPAATAVVRTSMQKKLGGYRKELPHTGDLEMWLRFAAHASVGALHSYQAYYREHGENMSLGYSGIKDFQQVKAAFDTLFTEYGYRIDDVTRLRELAERTLAERVSRAAHEASCRDEWAECRELFEFADNMWPGLQTGSDWRRLGLKLRLQPIMPIIRPILDGIRNIRSAVS